MADLGKVGITYDKNGYIATTPYEPLTVLKYTDGGTYMSILPTTGHLPTDTTYWVCMVPPTEAGSIDYTPLAGGVITNTTVQGAIEQADSLKFNKASVVQTNVNNANTCPNSALLYSMDKAVNDSLTNIKGLINLFTMNNGFSPILENTNLNNIVKTGIYNASPTCTNTPSSSWYFVISFVHSYDNQHMTQVAFQMSNTNTPIMAVRCKDAGTWKSWRILDTISSSSDAIASVNMINDIRSRMVGKSLGVFMYNDNCTARPSGATGWLTVNAYRAGTYDIAVVAIDSWTGKHFSCSLGAGTDWTGWV